MKPRQRFLTALRGEKPDLVPVSLSIGPSNAHEWLGRSDWRAVVQAHQMVGSIPTYGQHGSPVLQPQWQTGWGETTSTKTIKQEGQTYNLKQRKIKTPLGVLTSQGRINQSEDYHGQTLEPLLKTRDDYEIYLAYVEEWAKSVVPVKSDEVEAMQAEVGDEGVWVWWFCTTFYQFFWVLRPVQEYLLDFHDEPNMMRHVLSIAQKVNQKKLECFNDSRCQVLIVNCSGASTSVVSPDFIRKWVLPDLKWLSDNIAENKFIGFHMTGKMRDALPILLEANPDFVLRFESDRYGGDIPLKAAKEQYGDQVCLMGGYDSQVYLSELDEIRSETIRCIDQAAAGGGYILDNNDMVPINAEMEKVKAMVDMAKEYGRY